MMLYLLGGMATVLTLLGFLVPARVSRMLSLATLVAGIAYLARTWGEPASLFGGLYRVDSLAQGFTLVALLGVLWFLLAARSDKFEFPLFGLYAALGMHVMASSNNLVVMLLGLEVFSLPLYLLATWRRDEAGFEAGLKYFLLGALSSAVFIYGIALHFGATGSFEAGTQGQGILFASGLLLVMAALAFKVAMVPFHWWAPDVYQGSPTSVSLLMATAVKAAAFAALLRVLAQENMDVWGLALTLLVALTVLIGNLGALAQNEAKRLLAYSSIAHAGYTALALFSPTGAPAVGFYLLTYLLGTGLAFAVLQQVSERDVPYAALRGLIYRKPLLGVALGLALFSLAGLPPLVGFWGKYLVFLEAAKAGQYGLVVLALLTSAVAAYYYLKLFSLVVMQKPAGAPDQDLAATSLDEARLPRLSTSSSARFAIVVATILLVILGLVPGWAFRVFIAG